MKNKKTTLGLHLPTDPRWVNLAEMDLGEILTDHAYCEQKAATSCISLIQYFYEKEDLVSSLSPVVTEEWGHFRLVLKEMAKRGIKLGPQRKDDYVNGLLSFQKKGGNRDNQLLERLLTCALIEARSCERFRMLSLDISDETLKGFYHDFMVAEAAHYRLFLDLAIQYIGEEKTMSRWDQYLTFEADLLSSMDVRGDRIH